MKPPLKFAVFLLGGASAAIACNQTGSTDVASPSDVSFKSVSSRAAVVIRNSGCTLLDANAEIVFATRDLSILTQSSHLNTTLICKVKNVANPTGRALKFTSQNNPFFPGLECGTPRGSTTNWSETISASGTATLRCHVKLVGAGGDSV